ncbi:MAG: SDR family NAD(P)-dependent oxidoreductase [Anaerolineae bacterium]|nr:SDR family NAD(P)-dependent oxidoreductase [Anaerolineae bacterium]
MPEHLTSSPRVILITGASRGFGAAAARLLAQRGHRVYGTSRDPASAQAEGFTLLPLDVREDDSARRCVETVLNQAGRLDTLVNNAGVSLGGAVEEATPEEARQLFETNFFGVLRMTSAVLPTMRAARRGQIINISSLAGLVGVPYLGLYAASKHALEGYSASLRYELRRFGIAVSLVEAGNYRTDIRFTFPAQRIPDYDGIREQATAVHDTDVRDGHPPDPVARLIARIVESRHPRLRYVAAEGLESGVPLMRRFLPDALQEWILRRRYRA